MKILKKFATLGLSGLSVLLAGFSIVNAGAGNDCYDGEDYYVNQPAIVEFAVPNECGLNFKRFCDVIKNGDISYVNLSAIGSFCWLCIDVPYTGLDCMGSPCWLDELYVIDEENESVVLLNLSNCTFKSVFGSKYAKMNTLKLQNYTFNKIN